MFYLCGVITLAGWFEGRLYINIYSLLVREGEFSPALISVASFLRWVGSKDDC